MRLVLIAILILLAGCTSVGSLGLITKSSVDPIAAVKRSTVSTLGPAEAGLADILLLEWFPGAIRTFKKPLMRLYIRAVVTPWSM
jgi:hypothetical protein